MDNMKILTAKELKNYSAGKGCQCAAWGECECACGVDWTPKEVYVLRLQNKKLRAEIRKLKKVGYENT